MRQCLSRPFGRSQRMDMALAFMRKRQLALPFWTWLGAAQDSLRLRTAAARVVLRMQRAAVVVAWSAWAKHAQRVQWSRQQLDKAVRRMRRAAVAASWGAWHQHVAWARATRFALQGAVRRRHDKALGRAFDVWVQHFAAEMALDMEYFAAVEVQRRQRGNRARQELVNEVQHWVRKTVLTGDWAQSVF